MCLFSFFLSFTLTKILVWFGMYPFHCGVWGGTWMTNMWTIKMISLVPTTNMNANGVKMCKIFAVTHSLWGWCQPRSATGTTWCSPPLWLYSSSEGIASVKISSNCAHNIGLSKCYLSWYKCGIITIIAAQAENNQENNLWNRLPSSSS